MNRGIAPLFLAHLIARRIEPQHVFDGGPHDRASLKKSAPPEDGMPLPQVDHALNEREKIPVLGLQIPAKPACGIILTISIVVSHLRMPDRVTGIHHGYALRKEEGG